MRGKLIVFFTILSILHCGAQKLKTGKRIKFESDFVHKFSSTFFPADLGNGFKLVEVLAFDKEKKNIGVSYEKKKEPAGLITIYIYPANEGHEDRLRSEYLTSLQSVANLQRYGLGANQFPVKYVGENYICNGFKAEFLSEDFVNSNLSVYECGTWFFKIRMTTNETYSKEILDLENQILDTFDPSRLTAQKPLGEESEIYFAKAAFADSVLLASVMGSAFKKIEWAKNNLSEKERASGFPSHYLDLQIASFNELVSIDRKLQYEKSAFTKSYLDQINSLIDSNFLDEFIMKEFDMVMIVPENHEFDFMGYERWLRKNKIDINLSKLFYIISFK